MDRNPPPSPETVTEALEFLASEGYVDEVRVRPTGLECDDKAGVQPAKDAIVDYTFRFEGLTDPGDEAIVMGIRCPTWGTKAVLVSAFGLDMDPEVADVIQSLVKPPA
jgi:hypothetical protein